MLAAGVMNQRVDVQYDAGATSTVQGTHTPDWRLLFTVWAELSGAGGSEPFVMDQVQPGRGSLVRMRYRAGITPKMRLRVAERGVERFLNIRSIVDPDGRRAELRLACEEAIE